MPNTNQGGSSGSSSGSKKDKLKDKQPRNKKNSSDIGATTTTLTGLTPQGPVTDQFAGQIFYQGDSEDEGDGEDGRGDKIRNKLIERLGDGSLAKLTTKILDKITDTSLERIQFQGGVGGIIAAEILCQVYTLLKPIEIENVYDMIACLFYDDDAMGKLYNIRNLGHDELALSLKKTSREDLRGLTPAEIRGVAIMKNLDKEGALLCVVFKYLKYFSWALQEEPNSEKQRYLEDSLKYMEKADTTIDQYENDMLKLRSIFKNNSVIALISSSILNSIDYDMAVDTGKVRDHLIKNGYLYYKGEIFAITKKVMKYNHIVFHADHAIATYTNIIGNTSSYRLDDTVSEYNYLKASGH